MYFISNIASSDIDKLFDLNDPLGAFLYKLITPIKWLINLVIDFFGLTYEKDKDILILITFGFIGFMIGLLISVIKYTLMRIGKNTFVLAGKAIESKDKEKRKYKKYYILKDMIEEDIKNGRDLDMNKYQEYADKNHLNAYTANSQGIGYRD